MELKDIKNFKRAVELIRGLQTLTTKVVYEKSNLNNCKIKLISTDAEYNEAIYEEPLCIEVCQDASN
jgi:hypothetical protein